VSAYVDVAADGVILLIDSIEAVEREYAIRATGSSFAAPVMQQLPRYANSMYLVGINAADQLDAFIEDTNLKIYLVGQTKDSVVYYPEDVAIAGPVLGPWQ